MVAKVIRGASWSATAPVRADLAGGTLDLWPLGLLHPGGMTVSVAVSLRAKAEVAPPPRRGESRLKSVDLEIEESFSVNALKLSATRRGPLQLLRLIVGELTPATGVALTCESPVAAGSGLGASSALGIAAAAALLRYQGIRPRREWIVPLVRDLEAQTLGIPTGTQDHETAWLGGVVVLEHRAGGVGIRRGPAELVRALRERLVLVDSGQSRSSGPSNWDMYRRRIEDRPEARRALSRVARAGARAADALETLDWPALGRAMRDDLDARRGWSPLVVTRRLEQIFDAARKAGALGFKVCGAGGGGYAAILAAPAQRARVAWAVAEAGGDIADAGPTTRGLTIAANKS